MQCSSSCPSARTYNAITFHQKRVPTSNQYQKYHLTSLMKAAARPWHMHVPLHSLPLHSLHSFFGILLHTFEAYSPALCAETEADMVNGSMHPHTQNLRFKNRASDQSFVQMLKGGIHPRWAYIISCIGKYSDCGTCAGYGLQPTPEDVAADTCYHCNKQACNDMGRATTKAKIYSYIWRSWAADQHGPGKTPGCGRGAR